MLSIALMAVARAPVLSARWFQPQDVRLARLSPGSPRALPELSIVRIVGSKICSQSGAVSKKGPPAPPLPRWEIRHALTGRPPDCTQVQGHHPDDQESRAA